MDAEDRADVESYVWGEVLRASLLKTWAYAESDRSDFHTTHRRT